MQVRLLDSNSGRSAKQAKIVCGGRGDMGQEYRKKMKNVILSIYEQKNILEDNRQ